MLSNHASLVTKVGASVLKDIEGLNPSQVGFERAECCGPLPPKLPGSFEPLLQHIFLSSSVEAPQWDKNCSNVEGYEALRVAAKKLPQTTTTAFYSPSFQAPTALLMKYDEDDHHVHIAQYSGEWQSEELPWNAKGVIVADRSDETFIFVCSHRRRDDRCGYCGPMLIDLIRQAVANELDGGLRDKVHVFPCSHVGGHVYAGNVLVYTRRGGVCYGCFCPPDISALMSTIAQPTADVAESLNIKVRGKMGPAAQK